MGAAFSTFTDYMSVTDSAVLTGQDQLVNEAALQTYSMNRFLRGMGDSLFLPGLGSNIVDWVMFDEESTATAYDPNVTIQAVNPQVTTKWTAHWRFFVDHTSWTEHEILGQMGGSNNASKETKIRVYKNLKRIKQQRLWTSLLNFIEARLWAVPEAAEMEGEGTALLKYIYSIPAHINANTDGLFYKGAVPTGKTAWTTKQGIDPVLFPKWKPASMTYDSALVDNAGNIISKFDDMWKEVRFIPPSTRSEYFENLAKYRQVIWCSKRGQTIYQQLLRASNEGLIMPGKQDPAYPNPAYAGIDVEYVPALDTAKLYEAETVTDPYVTEMAGAAVAESNGPRYYWANTGYMYPVWHNEKYMAPTAIETPTGQPFNRVMYVDSWAQFPARSLRRQGIVGPKVGTDQYV